MDNTTNTYVTASELGDYVYCKRGWWLRMHGKLPTTERMIEGTMKHNHLSQNLQTLDRRKILAWLIVGIGIILFILYFLIRLIKL